MSIPKPDIIARVRLYSIDEGGRQSVLPPRQFGCPLVFLGEAFDCRILLDQAGVTLAPGLTADVPIKFLFPDIVMASLTVGARFKLWDVKEFAEGEVVCVRPS